jgi:predicted outer membrane repeat protein
MGTTRFAIRQLRLKPLAGCLATALAFASGSAAAMSSTSHAPPGVADLIERLHNGDTPTLPSRWQKPDPAEIALRWQPAPHEIPEVPANSIVVQNCNDSGNGSLRDALLNAGNGDTIDLTQLSCSTITLTTGSILFTQTSVTLQGPGSKYLRISGNDQFVPLEHDGLGTLYLNGLTVEHGMKYFTDAQVDDARGGCIFSGGSVYLSDSVVTYCTAKNTSTTHGVRGGAIYAQAGVTVSNSVVTNSSAIATSSDGGGIFSPGFVDISDSFVAGNYCRDHGGGVYTGDLKVKYSIIEDNVTFGVGGGTYSFGNASITNSTIAGNSAALAGGVFMNALNATLPATLLNSTVSGNMAGKVGGAWVGDYDSVRVANSTIAFNYESNATKYGAGLFLYGPVQVQSTIVGNNTYSGGTAPDDVGGNATAVMTGANNLFGFSSVPPPSGTIELESPMLAPLASNGGSTPTHRLLSGSPAIDAGNNEANVASDQRGTGYPRTIGAGTDIGAFELDTNDVIFANGFDP